MAYRTLSELMEREGGIAYVAAQLDELTGTRKWRTDHTDRNGRVTVATLVGGNIAPGMSEIARGTADRLAANFYEFSEVPENVPASRADRLRVEPAAGYLKPLTNPAKPLDSMLRKSIGVFVTDMRTTTPGVYITGQNRDLVSEIENSLRVAGVPTQTPTPAMSQLGANDPQHPANSYVDAGGVEVAIGVGGCALTPADHDAFAQLIHDGVNNYLNGLSEQQLRDALSPCRLGDRLRQGVQQRAYDRFPWLKRLKR